MVFIGFVRTTALKKDLTRWRFHCKSRINITPNRPTDLIKGKYVGNILEATKMWNIKNIKNTEM